MPYFFYTDCSTLFCSTVRIALCVKLATCVCGLHIYLSFSSPLCLLPPLSLCVLKRPLVSANHFWSISEIYGQFFPIIPASFLFLQHPTLYSPSVGSWIVCFSQEDTDEALILWRFLCDFSQLSSKDYLILIFNIIFQIIFSAAPLLLSFLITFSSLYLLRSFASPSCAFLASPPNRCDSLCDTKRAEAESCLCPFSLITSHLCVHKQTNTTINLRAWCRLRGRRREEKIR